MGGAAAKKAAFNSPGGAGVYAPWRFGIFKRIRRQSLRAADDLRSTGRIPLYRSYRLISYNGYFVGTKTNGAAAELEQRHLFKAAKWQ